jgi:zinc transport system substrate-binding protein
VICVFSEPQFEPKLVSLLVEGTEARTGTLDPLGIHLNSGADTYFLLMRGLAAAIRDCLAPDH